MLSDRGFFHYFCQSWRRAGSFGPFDAELRFSKRRRRMSSVGETAIPDSGRAWCYLRGWSAYPKRGSDIAWGLGLRSFLSATFVACTRRSAIFTRPLRTRRERPRRRTAGKERDKVTTPQLIEVHPTPISQGLLTLRKCRIRYVHRYPIATGLARP